MKKILALAAVAALTAGVSAFAANPFSDVTPDDWAYQAISDLSDQGVVEGYPDGTFKGERNMTRYELAQIIARLMAREDQLNAEQRATLDKLAGEYSDELANLGVRVGNLEKKVGNIYWSGDARMRYQAKSVGNDGWNGRIRITARGQVNDDTYVQGRFNNNMDFKGGEDSNTTMDQLFVNHNFGDKVSVRLGRQPIAFGDQGGWFANDTKGYDGGQIAYNDGKLSLTTGYGQFNTSDYKDFNDQVLNNGDNEGDFFFARGSYDFGFAKLGVDYLNFQDRHYTNSDKYAATKVNNAALDGTKPEFFGVNLNIPFAQKWNVGGEYWKNTTAATGDDTAWNAGLGYGKADWKTPGSFDLSVYYNKVDQGAFVGGTGWQTDTLSNLHSRTVDGETYAGATSLKFWKAQGNVTLQKNVQLHAEYDFAADADNASDPDDSWTVSLNYKF